MLVEKAWAKVCGSYEASEKSHVTDVFFLLSGSPSQEYNTIDYKMDVARGPYLKDERLDKLFQVMQEANKKGWVMTATTLALPAKIRKMGELAARQATIGDKGIRYDHIYTILDVRAVTLRNDYTDIILLLRNPSGKVIGGQQWLGDWGPGCDLWSKHTKRQVGATHRLTSASTFWMSLGDFFEQFTTLTVNHSDPTYSRRVLPADIPPKRSIFDSSLVEWGCFRVRVAGQHAAHAFFRIFQLNKCFLPKEQQVRSFEYPCLYVIVVKKSRLPPKNQRTTTAVCHTEYTYLNGKVGKQASIGLKIDSIRPGDYFIFYRAVYTSKHTQSPKLNFVMSGPADLVTGAQITKIAPVSFRASFFAEILRLQKEREFLQAHYEQPVL